jgi:two-component system, response regulator
MEKKAVEILLVDDSSADVELTLTALRRSHLANDIHICHDGEEALEYIFSADSTSLKLVLLDLKMPKVNGLQVLRAIKENPRKRPLPIVVFTSSNEERDMIESYDLGVNSYIQKPVDFGKFRQMVEQIGLYWLLVNQAAPVQLPATAEAAPAE